MTKKYNPKMKQGSQIGKKITPDCIFMNDIVVGDFVCETELQAAEELKRLRLAFRSHQLYIQMVRQ